MRKGLNINDFIGMNAEEEIKSGKTSTPRSPLIIAKRDPTEEDITNWVEDSHAAFIEAFTETEHNPTILYDYQIDYLDDESNYVHIDKARQVGMSYVFACKGVSCAHRMDKYTQIFISINQDEASEKIVYARDLYESLPSDIQRKLVFDNKKLLEFESNEFKGGRKHRTRIISHAQREPRGKGGNTFVVLDECAHYMFGDKIYIAAMPITTRGGGITLASTPLGKSGIHWKIMNDPMHKRDFSFHQIFWWNCPDFVVDGKFDEAQEYAPKMETADRVSKYGGMRIRELFVNMDIESFQQEYECHHVDETISYFPMSLLRKCVFSVITDEIFLEEDEHVSDPMRYPIEERNPDVNFDYFSDVEELMSYARNEGIKGDLYAGFDVGKKHHSAELVLLEDYSDDLVIMRFKKQFRNEKYEVMKGELRYILNNLPVVKMGIDDTGLGSDMGETLEGEFPGVCEGITFTNSWKQESATNVRLLLEAQKLAIPDDREILKQMHSIKRIVTEYGNLRLDAEKNKDHHGDIFWAIALACNYLKKVSDSTMIDIRTNNDDNLKNLIKRPTQRIFRVPSVRQVGGTMPFFGPDKRQRNE
jgi:phage FluMu gp28-like protein